MQNPFSSFFLGGFECADQINRSGERVNLLEITQHHLRVEEDYQLLLDIGITSVREGICWSSIETSPGLFDFNEVLNRIKIGEKLGIQQIWDMIHFGYPDDLFPTHPKFCSRFTNLCIEFVRFYNQHSLQPLLIIPINEISFLSWFSGDVRGTVPFLEKSGWDMKYHLCKAAILAIKAIREESPLAKIILVEPLVKVHQNGILSAEELQKINEYQFEAVDIIKGRLCPELGGNNMLFDILGINYYWNCQWVEGGETVYWPDILKVRVPLRQLLKESYLRYNKPIFISETGHFGQGRVEWLEEISEECLAIKQAGIPFFGICIYPVTDRPDWDNLLDYSNCGIFDLDAIGNRIPHIEYIESLKVQQIKFKDIEI
ncbi:hypothetical protein A5893_01245 [Pedobacter psychrophilus]|uniref:Beta-glucosidase n=1 Tax=Pedobacter psychrophilus TaxID=1826909 RepID=A0A179DM12_9SPHI|nr:hypothetical protein [Pedobacter psychrophilus]OAQ41770.1 hypothetical protein A5893_01245 [Pedobacter psychrophilus]